MTKDEALKLALEALDDIEHQRFSWRRFDAFVAIKQALVQPERQPLTFDAIAKLIDNCKANVQDEFLVELIRAVEAAHNIGAKP